MQTEEFLRRILPPLDDGGVYCWATPAPANSGRRFNQHFPSHVKAAVEGIKQLDSLKKNTYYAMASFAKRGSREQSNAKKVKAFWLDVDCGASKAAEGKGYATKREGAAALLAASKTLGLPQPMVVDSGNGLHAYWPLAEPITVDQWKPVALQLTAAFRSVNLIADYACTADESRILRPVGTSNWKDPENPKPVVLKLDAPDFTLDEISKPVSAFEVLVPTGASILGGLNSDLDLRYESVPASADAIADECEQMAQMRQSRGCVSEPQWRDCLGVIKHCDDPEGVAIEWSRGHSGFNRVETLAKLRQRKAPTRCETFDRDNPGVCARCIHWREITSPIQLGQVDEEDEAVEVEQHAVAEQPVVKESGLIIAPEIVKVEIPQVFELPEDMQATYQFAKGAMRVAKGEGWTAFCQQFVVMDDTVKIDGESYVRLRARFVDGSTKGFVIPASDLSSKDKVVTVLAKNGIIPLDLRYAEMHMYLNKWFQHVSQSAREMKQLQHFGWQPDNSFLLGNTLLKPDGTARPASTPHEFRQYVEAMEPQGSADVWREVVERFYGGEDMEQYMFILGVGFGAPLMKLTQQHGVIFSALSDSGFGKTACERIMLSIFGRPDRLIKSYKGMTPGAMPDFIGIMNSLPVVVDEITMANADHVANLAYDVSAGQSKNRLTREGKQRDVRDQWNTIVQTSSNFSLWERLASKGSTSDAQWLRMLEFNMVRNFRVTPDEARDLMDRLDENTGVVGLAYMQYVVKNRAGVAELVRKAMKQVEDMAGFEASERFWAAGVACVVSGLFIASRLNLIQCDHKAVLAWAVEQIKAGRRGLKEAAPGPLSQFNQMLTDLTPAMLITRTVSEGDVDERFINTPRTGWGGRVVIDQSLRWVTTTAVREWCREHNVSYAQVIDAGKHSGMILGEVQFDIGVGTAYSAPPVACFKITN